MQLPGAAILTSVADISGGPEQPPVPQSQLIDLTTTGRHTGDPRRVEVLLHNVGGRLYVTGMPNPARKRAWLHNLESDPRLTLHLKGSVVADLSGTARIIDEEAARRSIFARLVEVLPGLEIETMTLHSPLIEVTLADRDRLARSRPAGLDLRARD